MSVTIITKNSSSAGAIPSSGQLVRGELAVNVTDRKLYTLDSSNNVVLLSSGPVTLTTTGTSGASTLVGNALNIPIYGDGTVKSLSVVSANGFGGSVATATTTPAITLTTSVTGIIKGNGGGLFAATAGTDFQAPIILTTLNTSGAATFGSNTLNIPQYQGVVSLTTTGTTGAATFSSNTLNIPQYQGVITLSTTGTSGAATLVGNTLNVPNYTVAVAATPTAIGLVFGNTTSTITGLGNSVSIGAGVTSSVAVGTNSAISASIASVTAVGASSSVTGTSGTAIGSAATSVIQGTAIGATATVQTQGGVAIGNSADVLTSSTSSIAIGNGSSIGSATGVAIGVGATVNTTATNSIAIGPNSNVQPGGSSSIAIGNQASSGTTSIAIGNTTTALGTNSVAIGNGVTAAVTDGIAIGRGLSPSGARTILIGSSITDTSASNGIIAINSSGTTLTPLNNGLFISGIRAANGSTVNGVGSVQTFSTGTGNTKEFFTSQDSFTAYGVNWQKQLAPFEITGAGASTVDLTADQLATCIVVVTGSVGNVTLRMPTAASVNLQFPLISQINLTNISFDVAFINASSSFTVIIQSNTGMSASFGLTTIATSQSAVFRFRRTGTTTWSYNRISS